MDYMLKLWSAFTRFLDDGRICLSNNAAERVVVLRLGSWRRTGRGDVQPDRHRPMPRAA